MLRKTRRAIPRWTSRTCVPKVLSVSPARSPSARASSGRIRGGGGGLHLGIGLGEAADALLDLLRGDAGVGEAQARLAALEDEVGALDELDPARGGGGEQRGH